MIRVGAFQLVRLDERERVRGETSSSIASVGSARLYQVTGPDGLDITIYDTQWANGERDVVAWRRNESPERFDTLIRRLRLTVLDYDGPYVELRQARLRPNGHAGLFSADLDALDRAAGVNVEATLLEHGAVRVGTRGTLLGDVGRTRNQLGARFPATAADVPAVAHVLTRVCPVAAGELA